MECEICGGRRASKVAAIEGARLNVCDACARLGGVVSELRQVAPRRTAALRPQAPELTVVDDFDSIIRKAREAKGWKQEDLARKIAEPVTTLAKIEGGRMTPSEDACRKLERALGIKLLIVLQETAVEVPKSKESATTLGDVVTIRKRKA
jgi:putative transcription factor